MSNNLDLYQVLGLPSTCTQNDIEQKYKVLVKLYHPDNVRIRHKDAVNTEIRKLNAVGKRMSDEILAKFDEKLVDKVREASKTLNLINFAYEILTKKRQQYDFEYKRTQEEGDLEVDRLKIEALNYAKSQQKVSEPDITQWKKSWNEMNKRVGFNEGDVNRKVNVTKLVDDLRSQRARQDEELKSECPFNPRDSNMDKFHLLFEKLQKNRGEVMEYSEPQPMDDSNINFSLSDFSKDLPREITKQDLNELDGMKYERRDRKLSEQELNRKLREYELSTKELDSRKPHNFVEGGISKLSLNDDNKRDQKSSYDSKQIVSSFAPIEFGEYDNEYRQSYQESNLSYPKPPIPEISDRSRSSMFSEFDDLQMQYKNYMNKRESRRGAARTNLNSNLNDLINQRERQDREMNRN